MTSRNAIPDCDLTFVLVVLWGGAHALTPHPLHHPHPPTPPTPALQRQLMRVINETWPHPGHTLFNLGLPGSSLRTYAEHTCLESYLPRTVDLVIMEQHEPAPADGATGARDPTPYMLPLEHMISRVLAHVGAIRTDEEEGGGAALDAGGSSGSGGAAGTGGGGGGGVAAVAPVPAFIFLHAARAMPATRDPHGLEVRRGGERRVGVA